MKRAFLLVAALSAMPAAADVRDAMFHLRRGEPDLAYVEFRKAAEAGDLFAARSLGFLLYVGVDVRAGAKLEARPEEAVMWFRRGAEGGDAISAKWLGLMLATGRGVARNAPEALKWFRKGGEDVDAKLAEVKEFPEADRDELASWPLSLALAMSPEVSKAGRKRFPEGEATILVDPVSGKSRVKKSDSDRLSDMAREMFDEALLLAPPPPAAVRHKFVMSYDLDFRRR
jgi:TPR repeat protein